jgi:indoleamine 2,3-dioxygenase
MPQSHADFLAYVPTLPSLRSYVFSHPLQHNLTEAFNSAITRLGEFRDRHIQIVTRYIIIPSRTKSKAQEVGAVINLASASMIANQDRVNIDGPELHGTGGTQLIPFLRQTRDETNEAIRTT